MPSTTYRTRRRRRPLSQVAIGNVNPRVSGPGRPRIEVTPFTLCSSCDRPITPNGQCGC